VTGKSGCAAASGCAATTIGARSIDENRIGTGIGTGIVDRLVEAIIRNVLIRTR
jgi:hypothetical protein